MKSDMVYKKGNDALCTLVKNPNGMMVFLTICVGIIFGLYFLLSFPSLSLTKLNITSSLLRDFGIVGYKSTANHTQISRNASEKNGTAMDISKIWVPSNPRGAERLPPGVVASKSDLYLRRLWGDPSEDLPIKPNYLVTFTVGYDQRKNIDAAVKKFSGNFTILLFHYDGRTTEWDEFEWSKRAIHVSARQQTKWWYAKRFLHPDIVAPYDYIFIWDEDLGVGHFDAEEYIKLVRKYGLEISQPAVVANGTILWQMTKRRDGLEVHKETAKEDRPRWCSDPHLPPCAGFVEISAPVFSRDAWRCAWHLIQNDLVHGWGLDLALYRCVEPAHERIGVVDAQWIVHQKIPSLERQEQTGNEKKPSLGVRQRSWKEMGMFATRIENAERSYYTSMGIDHPYFTPHS